MKIFKCSQCGKSFESVRKKKYCKPECRPSNPKKGKSLNSNQLIIEKFLKNPKKLWADKKQMMKELSFCKLLVKKYGKNFWFKIKPPFKMISLSWFFSINGRKFLQIEKSKLKLDFSKERAYYKQKENPVAKSNYPKTNKTLLDFLRDE